MRTNLRYALSQLASIVTMSASIMAGAAHGEIPAVKLATTPALVSPSDAWTYYGSATTHTAGLAAWSTTPPEIKALARSLGAGRLDADQFTKNTFDYVRNNIDVEYRFGLGKGARGALIDQSGTPFDQAELMAKLLREGGLAPTVQVGTITLTASQFGFWSGLVTGLDATGQTFTVNAQAACQFLADGAIPALIDGVAVANCTSVSGNLTSVTLGQAWILVNQKLYDPSFKHLTLYPGVDLPAALGCGSQSASTCGSDALGALSNGVTTGTQYGVGYTTNFDVGGLKTYLNARAAALEAYSTANLAMAKVERLVGLSQVDVSYSPAVSGGLDYSAVAQFSISGEIPDQWRTRLHVEFANAGATIITKDLFADEIAGKRLQSYGTGGSLRLFVESQLLASAACSPCSPAVSMTLTHPYKSAFANETAVVSQIKTDLVTGGPPITLIAAMGEQGASTVSHFSALETLNPSPFVGATGSRPGYGIAGSYTGLDSCTGVLVIAACRSDTFASSAARALAQINRSNRLLAAVARARVTPHHFLGLVFYPATPPDNYTAGEVGTVMTLGAMLSIDSNSGSTSDRSAILETSSLVHTEMEQAALQQWLGLGIWAPSFSDFSAIRLRRYFLATTSAQVAAIPCNATINCANLQQAATDGYALMLQDDLSYTFAYKATSVSPLFLGSYKGATGAASGSLTQDVLKSVQDLSKWSLKAGKPKVDLGRGGLSLTPNPDLVAGSGSFPTSLPFQRFYDSSVNIAERNESTPLPEIVLHYEDVSTLASYYTGNDGHDGTLTYYGPDTNVFSRIGGGWTHNYQISANLSSDVSNVMGERSALEATAFVAGLYTTLDLSRQATFNSHVGATWSSGWLMGQFYNNTVAVSRPPSSETFLRLPSGAFSNGLSAPEVLIQTGAPKPTGGPDDYTPVNFILKLADGSAITFDVARKGERTSLEICDTDPNQTTYSCDRPGGTTFKATDWKFANGVNVHFDYAEAFEYPKSDSLTNAESGSHYELTRVSNSLGRVLNFEREVLPAHGDSHTAFSRLIAVTDEAARRVQFVSENCPASASNNGGGFATTTFLTCLTLKVVLPDSRVLKYDYSPATTGAVPAGVVRPTYRLWKVYTPSDLTVPLQTFNYDDLGRVASITDNLSHTASYFAGSAGGTERWAQGEAVSPGAALSIQIHDERNNVVKTIDALGRIGLTAYDDLGRVASDSSPELGVTTYVHDVRGNVTSTTNSPKPNSTLSVISTASTYVGGATVLPWACANLATCNRPLTETDARGGLTNYSWNADGSLAQSLAPALIGGARAQIDLSYLSFTGTDGASFTLLGGKTEKVSASQNLVMAYTYDTANHYVLKTATVDPAGQNLRTCFQFDPIGRLTATTDPRAGACP